MKISIKDTQWIANLIAIHALAVTNSDIMSELSDKVESKELGKIDEISTKIAKVCDNVLEGIEEEFVKTYGVRAWNKMVGDVFDKINLVAKRR